jgi:hypothetical protein
LIMIPDSHNSAELGIFRWGQNTSRRRSNSGAEKSASANVVTMPGAPWQCWHNVIRPPPGVTDGQVAPSSDRTA